MTMPFDFTRCKYDASADLSAVMGVDGDVENDTEMGAADGVEPRQPGTGKVSKAVARAADAMVVSVQADNPLMDPEEAATAAIDTVVARGVESGSDSSDSDSSDSNSSSSSAKSAASAASDASKHTGSTAVRIRGPNLDAVQAEWEHILCKKCAQVTGRIKYYGGPLRVPKFVLSAIICDLDGSLIFASASPHTRHRFQSADGSESACRKFCISWVRQWRFCCRPRPV